MPRILNRLVGSKKNSSISQIDNSIYQPQWATVDNGPCRGVKLYISDAFSEMKDGNYDAFLYYFFEHQYVDLADAVIWDVGSHIGYHSLAFANLVGEQGKVISFEPNPFNLQRLRINLRANPQLATRIEIIDTAISNEDGLKLMRITSDIDHATSSGSYLDYGEPPSNRHSYEKFESINVKIAKADTLLEQSNILPPKFIKVDIEGAEVKFLQGAHKILTFYRPFLAIEIHNIQCMYGVYEILSAHNYQLRLLDDDFNSSSRCFVFASPNIANLIVSHK